MRRLYARSFTSPSATCAPHSPPLPDDSSRYPVSGIRYPVIGELRRAVDDLAAGSSASSASSYRLGLLLVRWPLRLDGLLIG
jgi:hypothetical protein